MPQFDQRCLQALGRRRVGVDRLKVILRSDTVRHASAAAELDRWYPAAEFQRRMLRSNLQMKSAETGSTSGTE